MCNVLLQIMDDGCLTDGKGRKVDLNTVTMTRTSVRVLQSENIQTPLPSSGPRSR
jgi:ATP-dependent Clp protease ATP-binding subunit ClpA